MIFKSDTGAGVKLTMPQAVRMKAIQKDGFKCPDLMIFEPNGFTHGLFLELKSEIPWTKEGNYKSTHIRAQSDSISALKNRGYDAHFVWTLDQAIEIIEEYLK